MKGQRLEERNFERSKVHANPPCGGESAGRPRRKIEGRPKISLPDRLASYVVFHHPKECEKEIGKKRGRQQWLRNRLHFGDRRSEGAHWGEDIRDCRKARTHAIEQPTTSVTIVRGKGQSVRGR